MNQKEYYTAPSDEVFNTIKEASIDIWNTYDDSFGYATEKIDRIKNIPNFKDNTCYMVAMFDGENCQKLLTSVGGETKNWLDDLLNNNQT